MAGVSVQITGLDELARDIERAADLAPDEFKIGMKKITRKFTKDLKNEARSALSSTMNITSGFKMSPIKMEGDTMVIEFMPEGRGNKNHHWHLQEEGYILKLPNWKSRAKVIRYKEGGKTLGFVPGKQMVNAILPDFTDYMEGEMEKLADTILKENNL